MCAREALPLRKAGGGQRGTTSFGVVFMPQLEVLAILKGGGAQ